MVLPYHKGFDNKEAFPFTLILLLLGIFVISHIILG